MIYKVKLDGSTYRNIYRYAAERNLTISEAISEAIDSADAEGFFDIPLSKPEETNGEHENGNG